MDGLASKSQRSTNHRLAPLSETDRIPHLNSDGVPGRPLLRRWLHRPDARRRGGHLPQGLPPNSPDAAQELHSRLNLGRQHAQDHYL